jgi:hypothetical protein
MKINAYFLWAIIGIGFLASCEKTPTPEPEAVPIYTPYSLRACPKCYIGSGYKNGHFFPYTFAMEYIKKDDVYYIAFLNAEIDSLSCREDFYFVLPPKKDKYILVNEISVGYTLLIDDGDVSSPDKYALDTLQHNYVTITHLDTVTRTIGGEGEMHFRIKDAVNKYDKRNPDRVDLTGIKFYGTYYDR